MLLASCTQRSKSISFYYWRTSFRTDSAEQEALHTNAVQTLYVRYFDVDFLPADSTPKAIAPLTPGTGSINALVIPVIYIKNRALQRLEPAGIKDLCKKIYGLATAVSLSINKTPAEIQFDCDWTETTRDKYFLLLQQYKMLSKQIIAATIRLHQVKYLVQTGVPPVNHGILMYYNMGNIDAGTTNSIYEKSISSGLSFNFLYDSRHNSINPEKGFYANGAFRNNFSFLEFHQT